MKNRQGSYKKVLIAEGLLGPHRDTLIKSVNALIQKELTPFETCSLYILLFLRIRHPKNWLQKKSGITISTNDKKILDFIPTEFHLNPWEQDKLKGLTLLDLFINYNLKGIPLAVNRTMINWHQGLWSIALLTHIPGPRELLKMQVNNTRCVTMTIDPEEIDKLVLSSRDPLSFVLHDLHHADMFFNNKESLKGQLGFYTLVEKIYDEPLLKQTLKSDRQFKTEFDYVVSDMNAYVIHLFKCFKSAFIRTDEENQSELFPQILQWWQMPPLARESAFKLNTPEFNSDHEEHLKNFFENSREIYL